MINYKTIVFTEDNIVEVMKEINNIFSHWDKKIKNEVENKKGNSFNEKSSFIISKGNKCILVKPKYGCKFDRIDMLEFYKKVVGAVSEILN